MTHPTVNVFGSDDKGADSQVVNYNGPHLTVTVS